MTATRAPLAGIRVLELSKILVEDVNHHITEEVRPKPTAHWLPLIKDAGVPCAGQLEQIALPLTFDGERPAPRSAPPTLGQNRDDILAELGLGEGDHEGRQG